MGTNDSDLRGGTARGEAAVISVFRNNLKQWDASRPTNFFAADLNFQRSLEFQWGVDT